MKTFTRKPFILTVIVTLSIAFLVLLLLLASDMTKKPGGSTVGTINGAAIAVEEFRLLMDRNKPEISSYFGEKYGSSILDSPEFWDTTFSGERPSEVLKEKALRDCVRIKVQQLLALEKKLIADTSYSAFTKALKDENNRRKRAIEKGEIIYGPEKFSEEAYFFYYFQTIVDKIKENLRETRQLSVDDKEITQYYLENRDQQMKKYRSEVSIISIPYIGEDNRVDETEKTNAEERIKEAYERLSRGESFEALQSLYNPGGERIFRVFTEATARADASKRDYLLKEEAMKLKKGETSDIFNEKNTYYILRCIEKKDLGYFSLDERKDLIKGILLDRKYASYVDNLAKTADIRVNDKVYQELSIQ